MKILVTGSGGFIGQMLCKKLNAEGYMVLAHKKEDGDVRELKSFDKYDSERPEKVIHLAALTFVPESWENPSKYLDVNINGTRNVLEKCRLWGSEIIYPSTYVYGIPEYLPINESHKVDPANPYAYSKFVSEGLCGFYAEKYNVPALVIRPFNIYGPGQSAHFLIPTIIRQIIDEQSKEISLKTLKPRRDLIYIDDFIELIIKVLDFSKKKSFDLINAGSGESFSVEEIVQILLEISGYNKAVIEEKEIRKSEVFEIKADISKAKKEYNFGLKTGIREGLKQCYDHAKEKG
ncbi:NAD(P)-dependent oxidoreductase [Hyphobacterium sp. CCMP332]|nr:NAD(P)-dependent oxidoreductase [Hyphobacterium sp. CCMP332]